MDEKEGAAMPLPEAPTSVRRSASAKLERREPAFVWAREQDTPDWLFAASGAYLRAELGDDFARAPITADQFAAAIARAR